MANQFKNLMIGLFVTAAAAIIIFILMFLHPRMGDEEKLIYARFTDIDKVTIGTRVTYAGKPVGEVVGINEIETGRAGRADASGHIYLYELTLRVDSGVNIYNTDNVGLRTSGLLGEKNIEITPIAPEPGQILRRIDNEPVYAIETGSVEQTFKEFKEVADKLDKALDVATEILNRVRDQRIVEKISNSLSNIESITDSINKPEKWAEILDNVLVVSSHFNKTLDNIDEAAHNINLASIGFSNTATSALAITTGISEGKGALGRFLSNDEMYLRTSSIMSKLETTLDDINHYGLLFHSDKGWQRLRARRVNLLQKLRTPQEFQNYFNDEINQVSTSLSRVTNLLTDVQEDPYCYDMLKDREFTKVFADLMRRIGMLEEEVRLYNTQIVEMQIHDTQLGNPPMCDCNQCDTPCNWNPQQ